METGSYKGRPALLHTNLDPEAPINVPLAQDPSHEHTWVLIEQAKCTTCNVTAHIVYLKEQ